ncbi:MAG: cell filamentation protein Fic, partial [Elusimicrobiota bacterium]|nr:cell filamentation protein Fic [Elusimicrobiota bacterium]
DAKKAKEQSNAISKSKNCTLNGTFEENFVLEFLKINPKAMQNETAARIRKLERTVKSITSNLQRKKIGLNAKTARGKNYI